MFRIISCVGGWMVQVKSKTWYGREYWKPYMTYRGSNNPYYYATFESAMSSLFRELRWEILSNGLSKEALRVKSKIEEDGIDMCGYFG